MAPFHSSINRYNPVEGSCWLKDALWCKGRPPDVTARNTWARHLVSSCPSTTSGICAGGQAGNKRGGGPFLRFNNNNEGCTRHNQSLVPSPSSWRPAGEAATRRPVPPASGTSQRRCGSWSPPATPTCTFGVVPAIPPARGGEQQVQIWMTRVGSEASP